MFRQNGDYLVIKEFRNFTIEVTSLTETWKDYESYDKEDAEEYAIILHQKYITDLGKIWTSAYGKEIINIMPTRSFLLKVTGPITTEKTKWIKDFYQNWCTRKIIADIRLEDSSDCSVTVYEEFIDTLFDSFNITSLTLKNQRDKYGTKNVYKRILDWKSLRTVKLINQQNFEAELDIIGKNPFVKQWILDHSFPKIYKKYIDKLQSLILKKNDNSICIKNCDEIEHDVPILSQTFEISPT